MKKLQRAKESNTTSSLVSKSSSNSEHPTETPSSNKRTLALKDFKRWSIQEVSAVLMLPEREGGVGLTVEKVKPLYESSFDGQVLSNIAQSISRHRNSGSSEEECIEHGTKMVVNTNQQTGMKVTPELSNTIRAVVEQVEAQAIRSVGYSRDSRKSTQTKS